jgi:hypothetical protein
MAEQQRECDFFEPQVGAGLLEEVSSASPRFTVEISKIGVQNVCVLFFLAGTSVPFLTKAVSSQFFLTGLSIGNS